MSILLDPSVKFPVTMVSLSTRKGRQLMTFIRWLGRVSRPSEDLGLGGNPSLRAASW
jgi:hypothetical protein